MAAPSNHRAALRGLAGTLAIILVVLASLNFEKLPLIRNTDTITVDFPEAAGLKSGDDVLVSGATVGKVTDVHLDGATVVATLAFTDGNLHLGNQTQARIVTITLLGRAGVELVPGGTGDLQAGDTIPMDRTSAPYNITSALNQLTDTSAAIDKNQLQTAIRQVSSTFAGTPNDVGPALNGLERLADTVSTNDGALRQLLARANAVTKTLSGRDQQIAQLLTSGNSLLTELNARQKVITDLLADVSLLSTQLRAVVNENNKALRPALTQLNKVADLLNRNSQNLKDSITGVRNYATAFGEAISSGPFFDAYIQNLTSPGTLAPIISGIGS